MSLALGLARERAADPRGYALGKHEPRLALRPASAEEAAEALRAASAERLGVVLWGGGTRRRHMELAGGYELALDLSALDRIVEYDPEDMTITAQCGVTLQTLRVALAARGQELPLEAARAGRATLGGTLAANGSGPRRRRFGSPADRILGARYALADGTLARSGGKVVKNVAGHAIHRLLCGSRGGLAAILEASLKLAPAPEVRVALVYGMKGWQVSEAARWTSLPRLEPSFVTVLGARAAGSLPEPARLDAPFTAVVGLEDDAAWVTEQETRIAAALGAPAARLEGEPVVALTQALADAEDQEGARLTLTSAHVSPAALAPLLERAEAERLVCHALAGRLHWYLEESDASRIALALHQAGYSLIERRGPVALQEPLPPQVAIAALRERIRAALDPAGTLVGSRG